MSMVKSKQATLLGIVLIAGVLAALAAWAALPAGASGSEITSVDDLDGKTVVIKNGGWLNIGVGGAAPVIKDGCLDVHGGIAGNGRDVRLWKCNDTAAQQFTLEKRTSGDYAGYYRLVSQAGRGTHCVDNRGDFRNSGRVNIWACLDDDHHVVENQSVRIDLNSNGYFTFTFVADTDDADEFQMQGWGSGYYRDGTLIRSWVDFRGNVKSNASDDESISRRKYTSLQYFKMYDASD